MRIVFDARYTRIDHHDGISRYTANLVAELAKLHPVTMLISDHRQLAMLPDLPWQIVSAPTSALEPLVARAVNKLRPDIVFTPMQTMGSWGRRYALLLTVHDLIYYRNRTPPRDLAAPIRLLWRLYHLAWWPQRMLLNRADGVVTVSNTTAALIAEHDLTRKPVTVVSNAAAPLPATADDADGAVPQREAPDVRRLVYMGSYMPYKNVDTLVRAAAMLPGTELHLMSRVTDAERTRLQRLAPSAVLVFHDGASDAEYAETLRSATALVTASRDEGFGIPLVEAMSVGTPIVVSDIPIFREIGGDAALYFDVDDAQALAAAVTRLDDLEEWQRRSALGLERAATFTWAASARTLLGVLEETVARRRRR
ncbi:MULTISPECIES: glycosyltransferase family 4 protein [unclassified Leifsonia]|uniref:glycosyltransferase family 4 protein n=1 Tax=unclassified Leifsonia TaxID=2663824 RepID=UPI0006F51F0B|nr:MULTISPECIES: glycosyltransferase family 1 protein [unclassified Leifsonia]KQX06956.1 mannosyltransferase [Leifsonia sp. Root1293]KRA11240.1 mannosyltransferase [Leifsonia sp. Root60]